MARFIDCPNNGKCGFGRHILGSDSYNKCLKAASGHSVRGAVNNAVSSLPPAAAPHPRNRTEELLGALDYMRGCDSYLPPRSYVGDMTFDNDEIQGIIDTGSASHMKAEREQMLKSRIRCNLDDVAQEIGFEGSDNDLDALSDMVFDDEKSDIVSSIVKNHQEPRLLTLTCKTNDMFSHKHKADIGKDVEVGSDLWFDLLATSYSGELKTKYDDGPHFLEEYERDHQAILSALKDVIGDDVDKIDDDYVFPDIQIMWSGKLEDVVPYGRNGAISTVKTPSFFFTRNGEKLTDPIRLVGHRKIFIPSEESAGYGSRTGIKDDMSSESPYFDHSDISQYSSSVSQERW